MTTSKPLTHNEMISAIFAGNTEAVRLEAELEKVTKERDEARRERDEARDVMHSVVEEFVQHSVFHARHQPTPIHQCEFQYAPEYGKCDACETWSDYVRICHPHADTEEEDNHNA